MRKLPVYLVLDTSGSMYGEPIEAVKNGIELLVSTLKADPYALETAFLSVITFSTTAEQVVPLTELISFRSPDLQASGLTSLGDALKLLAERIETEVTKTTMEVKGDWKPLVFLMTDGAPTDDITEGLKLFKEKKVGMVVACAAGNEADTDVLKSITECVVKLDTADSATIKSFFSWVSASVSVGSTKIETSNIDLTKDQLPPPPAEINILD